MDLVFAGQSATDEVIANLIDKASSYLGSNPDRLQESMRMLRLKLPIMCDTLVPAQSRESYSGLGVLLDESLWRLRDAVEELEDAVDEHAYHEKKTKEREVSDGDLGSSFSKMKQRVIKSLANGRTLERRLRKAIEALDMVIVDIAKRLPSDVRLTHEQLDEHRPQRYRMTAGFPFCEERVLGREKETDVIVRWLIDPLNDDDAETQVSPNNHHVSVMSIVGHGGVGKTTLAQLHILQDKINSTKAFLLVLDDVWEENLHEWEKLFSVLRGINTRIKILLTTRTQSVATLVESVTGCEDQHLRLHELEENGNLQIFCQLALADLKVGSEGYAELQSIGAKIVKKLGGTPVAIKIAAYQLRLCPTLEFWRRFLHRMDKEAVPNIMDVLKISYYRLSAELLSLLQLISKKSSIQKGGVGEDLDLVRIDISSIREKGRRVILGSIDCKFVP
uniref:NB-ARC domain-containing protein n=1 Tax=Oryza barthii TaxID=65489 RepID=A0A0D3HSF6_9ORYZ